MTEDRIRELFREMRDEPIPGDSRARVRMAVAERTQSWRERVRRHWKIAATILVPVCAVLVVLVAREPAPVLAPPAPVVTRPMIAENAEPVAPPQTPVNSPPPVVRVTRRIVKPRIVKPRSADTAEAATLIRIEDAGSECRDSADWWVVRSKGWKYICVYLLLL